MNHKKKTKKSELSDTVNQRVVDLLTACGQLLGTPVILHDYLAMTRLPLALREHVSRRCLSAKSIDGNSRCSGFCGAGGQVDQWIVNDPRGCVHRCPFDAMKIAVPMTGHGMLSGIIFAGPLPDDWSADRTASVRRVLVAVAHEVEQLIFPWQSDTGHPSDRRHQILSFLTRPEHVPATVGDLAAHLGLSDSRTRHLVKELFGQGFSQLSIRLRLQRAAGWLTLTDQAIAEVALALGFCDQSHFTKAFVREYGLTPRRWRIGRRASSPAEV